MVRQVETELLAVSAGDHISAALSSALSELGATDKGLSCVRTAEGQYVIKAPEPGRGIKEATISVKVSGEVRCPKICNCCRSFIRDNKIKYTVEPSWRDPHHSSIAVAPRHHDPSTFPCSAERAGAQRRWICITQGFLKAAVSHFLRWPNRVSPTLPGRLGQYTK